MSQDTPRPRSVPWKDWNEWIVVKKQLYSAYNDQGEAKYTLDGFSAVDVWRARGGVPHSIDSTVCLIQIIVADEEATASLPSSSGYRGRSGVSPSRSELDLRMTYSLAIIRAINGLVDPSQKGLYADSVMSIAASHGIPSWIVELRHDGTHNQLPSLGVLRAASKYMVKWFYDNYWEVQHRRIKMMEEDNGVGDIPSSSLTRIDRNALEALGEASNTGITGIFIPNILLGGGRDPGQYYSDFVDSSGDASRVFEHMCRGRRSAAIDAVLARLFVCAMDEVDSYVLKDRPDMGDTEELLATLITCKDLLDKAAGPWQAMHSTHLGEGETAPSGEQAVMELHVPMRLLRLYWSTLLARANALEQGFPHSVPGEALTVLTEMTSRFHALVQTLALYGGQGDNQTGREETAENKGIGGTGSGRASGKGRKRAKESETLSQGLPAGWTVVEPDAGGAWPLGLPYGSTL